jgi:serine/threonine protein kinase
MITELVVLSPGGNTRRVACTRDLFTIGRSPVCDLAFPENPMISRQHAAIRREGGTHLLVDLGSANGVCLNGVRIADATALNDGDRIELGDVTLICVADEVGEAVAPQPPPPSATAAAGRPIMTFKGQKLSVTVADIAPFAFGRASTLFKTSASGHGDVCVKLFPQVKGAEWESVALFEREVLAQSSLHHPNVLPVLDYGMRSEPHGSPFLILPFCSGGSLRNLTRERSFHQLAGVKDLLLQAAAGLDAAHEAGFVHGDVKPENILLSGDRSQAFLSDFGMSKLFAIQERFTTQVPGEPAAGTTAYLSPEQISKGEQTALSDIYSFAMVAYELLTGRFPIDRDLPTFRQMLAKVKGETLDPRRFSPSITDDMTAALLAGLAVDPLMRPRSARAFCRQLLGSEGPRGPAAISPAIAGRSVFISYSHLDAEWVARVRAHLRPLERAQMLQLWDDTRIRPGADWRREIGLALDACGCAILLVSANFLASDFCTIEEFPRLLRAARDRGAAILPLIVSPCRVETVPELVAFQAVNPPSRTLAEMSGPECDRALIRLVDAVQQSLAGDRVE